MCFGGHNDAVKAQQQAEAQRQAHIQQAVDTIDRMFKYGSHADQAHQLQDQIASLQAAEQPHQVSQQVPVPAQLVPIDARGSRGVGGERGVSGPVATGGGGERGGTSDAAHYKTVTHTVPGVDHSAQINDIQQQLGDYATAAQAPYDTYAHNIQNQLMQDLNRQRAEANRNVEFSLARRGLTGGSADVNAGATLLHDYNQGVLAAQQKAQQARADFQSADQQAKQQLISLAQSGLSTGSAQAQAADALRANLANAKAQATQATLGDVFQGLGQAQLANQIRQGRQSAQQQYNQRYGNILSSPTYGNTS